MLESQHRTIKVALFISVHESQQDWVKCLPEVISIINRQKNSATHHSPFETVFLEKTELSKFDLTEKMANLNVDEYTKNRLNAKKILHEKIMSTAQCFGGKIRKMALK